MWFFDFACKRCDAGFGSSNSSDYLNVGCRLYRVSKPSWIRSVSPRRRMGTSSANLVSHSRVGSRHTLRRAPTDRGSSHQWGALEDRPARKTKTARRRSDLRVAPLSWKGFGNSRGAGTGRANKYRTLNRTIWCPPADYFFLGILTGFSAPVTDTTSGRPWVSGWSSVQGAPLICPSPSARVRPGGAAGAQIPAFFNHSSGPESPK